MTLISPSVLAQVTETESEPDSKGQFASWSKRDSPTPTNETVTTNVALSKLRLPRKLLEIWVEEPFFEKAVVGCFVRLGVGAFACCLSLLTILCVVM